MGWKWEVNGWRHYYDDVYDWEQVYAGNSMLRALWRFFIDRNLYGCIKLERRK